MYSQQAPPDFVYFNGNIIPDTTSTSHQHGQIIFNSVLYDNLITDSDKFEMAIDRVQFDASLIPIWIPLLDTTVNNGTTTVYKVYMWIDDGVNAGPTIVPLIYNNDDYILFHTSSPNDYMNNPYYWVNSMKRFVTILNTAITTAFNDLKVQINQFTGKCPFVRFDSTTELFSVYFDVNTVLTTDGGASNGAKVVLGFNTHLQLLLRHFNYSQINMIESDNDIGHILNPINDYGLNTLTYSNDDYIYITQESKSVEFFSPVSSIVFSSDQLPIVGDITSIPKTITQSRVSNSSIGTAQKVITDIVISMTSLFDYKQIITYIPTQYRWISMDGTNIKNINVAVYWRSKFNAELYPFFMSSIGFCQFKFVFRHK